MIDKLTEITDAAIKPSQCPYCGHGSFTLKVMYKRIIRFCKGCESPSDPENPTATGLDLWKYWQENRR